MAHEINPLSAVAASLTDIQATFSVSDEDSKVWLIAQIDGTTVPVAAEIIAGLNGDSAPADSASDTGGLVPVGAVAGAQLGGLVAGATYDVFAVATDADGANDGAVKAVANIVMSDEYIPPATGDEQADFPDNSNDPAPEGEFGSTLPDAGDYSLNLYAAPGVLSIDSVVLDGSVPSIVVTTTVNGAGAHALYVGAYPVGAPAPTLAELKAGTGADDSASDLGNGDGAPAVASLLSVDTEQSYNVFISVNSALGDSVVMFVGQFSTVDATDKPYLPVPAEDWVTAFAPVTVLNAGAYSSPNKTFPVEFATVISQVV